MTLQLWGRPSSARTQKVMLALAELNFTYEFIKASATMGPEGSVSRGKTPYGIVDTTEYLEKNPNGTIPTINDEGFILWESNAIVQYLGMKYNPKLFYDANIETFCSASRWMMWENNQLIPPMHDLAKHLYRLPEGQRDEGVVRRSKEKLFEEFKKVEVQLSKTRFISGDQWCMGDIPMTIRCHRWNILAKPFTDFPNLSRYYQELSARPSFNTISAPELHTAG